MICLSTDRRSDYVGIIQDISELDIRYLPMVGEDISSGQAIILALPVCRGGEKSQVYARDT